MSVDYERAIHVTGIEITNRVKRHASLIYAIQSECVDQYCTHPDQRERGNVDKSTILSLQVHRYDHFLAAVAALVTAFDGPFFPFHWVLVNVLQFIPLHGSKGQPSICSLAKRSFLIAIAGPRLFAHEWPHLIISV